jgi:hypothetical protein
MQNLVSGTVFKGKIEDDAYAENGVFVITGMITGSFEVKKGAQVTLRGMVCGDTVTEDGSNLNVTGMINGCLIVKGGTVEVSGMINKDLVNQGGQVVLHKVAKVLGKVIGECKTVN